MSAARRQPIEVRREQVLDAALRLIADEGYAAASMEAVAREAGVAKTVVYAAYAGRGVLLRALLEREEARTLGQLAAALPPRPADEDPERSLITWLRAMAEAIAADPVPWRLILLPTDGTPREVRDHVEQGRAFALAQARALAVPILARRASADAIDEELAARSLLALAEEGARLLVRDPDTFTPDRLARFAAQVVAALR